MIVYVFPADLHGCGHYRMIWPAAVLASQGHDVRIVSPKQRGSHLQARTDANGRIVDVGYPPDADIIVLQRITHVHLIRAIELMRERGVAVVIDMDDDLAAIPTENPAFGAMHPKFGVSRDHSWLNTQRACEAASLVTVSTDALLARYAPHGRGRVLRNCVPAGYLEIPHEDSDVVGWGGSVHSHPNDLQVTGSALAQLTREGVKLRIVGPPEGVAAALRLDGDDSFESTGPRQLLGEWPAALAELGVGIAPLADTRFNVSKSWLKPLEKAAVGVPCVMSPRAEYARICDLGIGVLARKPKDWLREVRRLATDGVLRRELSARGREVAGMLTVEGNAWRWLEAWTDALAVERGPNASSPPRSTASAALGVNQRPALDGPRQAARAAYLDTVQRLVHTGAAATGTAHPVLAPADAPPVVLG